MSDEIIQCWVLIDPETGEFIARCSSRKEARELAIGAGPVIVAKVVRSH